MHNRKEHVLTILAEFMPLSNQSIDEVLYPEIDAYSTGFLQVSELHTIAWERSGNPYGIPVIVIHGGPGGVASHLIEDISILKNLTSSNSIKEDVDNPLLTQS